ncbi:MAG: EndoU domain-containing protein [Nitrospirota bacterium]
MRTLIFLLILLQTVFSPAVVSAEQTNNPSVRPHLISPHRAEHILHGDRTGGGHLWPGRPGKTPFPKNWSEEKILHEISNIATDPQIHSVDAKMGRTTKEGVRDGVKIRVVMESKSRGGGVVTGYPLNLKRNRQ